MKLCFIAEFKVYYENFFNLTNSFVYRISLLLIIFIVISNITILSNFNFGFSNTAIIKND